LIANYLSPVVRRSDLICLVTSPWIFLVDQRGSIVDVVGVAASGISTYLDDFLSRSAHSRPTSESCGRSEKSHGAVIQKYPRSSRSTILENSWTCRSHFDVLAKAEEILKWKTIRFTHSLCYIQNIAAYYKWSFSTY